MCFQLLQKTTQFLSWKQELFDFNSINSDEEEETSYFAQGSCMTSQSAFEVKKEISTQAVSWGFLKLGESQWGRLGKNPYPPIKSIPDITTSNALLLFLGQITPK